MEAEDATSPGKVIEGAPNESVSYPKIEDIEDRNTTAEESPINGSEPDPSTAGSFGFNFWDVSGYKKTVKRIDDGARLCDDFLKLLAERAEIEGLYAAKLQGEMGLSFSLHCSESSA